jgi:colanic acid biosynthesis glycosyl transferase WcaI
MQVLLVGINYAPEPSGIAPYSTRIAEGLRARGHGVRVLTTYPHYPQWRVHDGYSGLRQRERRGRVDVRRVKHYVPQKPDGVKRAASEVSFGVHAAAHSWGRPDVVLCPSPALLSSALVRLRTRAAFGLQIQDLYSAGVAETGGSRHVARALGRVEAAVARRATGVAVIHDRFRDRVVDSLGVDEENVRVIRNWTHLDAPELVDNAGIRAELGWGDDYVVLHSGAMGRKQGLESVVEAARLAERRGLPVRFVLAGDGWQRAHLEKVAQGIGTIDFIDPLPGAAYVQALHAADVLLVNELPGLNEMAVPSKLTSYMKAGRPVLAATSAGTTTADELAAAGAGPRVEPGDPEALLAGVEMLRAEPGRADEWGANGPTYCERVLSETHALDSYDDWIHELVDRHHGRKG